MSNEQKTASEQTRSAEDQYWLNMKALFLLTGIICTGIRIAATRHAIDKQLEREWLLEKLKKQQAGGQLIQVDGDG